jgi:hypothetical protein
VGAAGQPGHDLGDPGEVAWGRSLGYRPILSYGDRQASVWRAWPSARVARRPPGDGGALDGVQALPTRERTFGSAAACVGRWDISLGQRRVPPYAARRRFARSLSVPADGKRQRAKRSLSLVVSTYSALGGLRQDPGGGAESSAEATTCGNEGTTCVCCRRMGDAMTSNQWWDRQCGRERSGRWCGCARRPTGRSGRTTRQRKGSQRRVRA